MEKYNLRRKGNQNRPGFLKFDRKGLVPAIVQDYVSGEVLMLAYMNKEAFELTLETGTVHYFSRSRNKLWKKGEESGNLQLLKEMRFDCDGDTLLLKIIQKGGAACHTGYKSCFFRKLKKEKIIICGKKVFNPAEVYCRKK